MATVFTVLADSRDVADAELDRLCQLLGLAPLGAPSAILGRGRWLARATESSSPAGVEKQS